MTSDEYMAHAYTIKDGKKTLNVDGLGIAVKNIINYVFYFVEIVCTYPVEALANALPTLAYFLYADGLASIVSGILVPVTTLTNRFSEVIDLDINAIGAGLIDYLATGDWENFQESLGGFVYIDEETGELVTNVPDDLNLTYSVLSLLTNLEFDLSSIVGEDDPYGGKYGLVLFLNKENEHMAKQLMAQADELEANGGATADQIAEMRQQARDCRAGTLKQFLKAIAALGDPVSEHKDIANTYIKNNYSDYVYISSTGTVHVSKAEVLMFLLDFVFENQTLKEVIGSLLGYDITDDNEAAEVELLDEIITNVFNNPEALIDLLVSLFTGYKVKDIVAIELIDIEAENHFEFYEDAGYETHEDVLAHNKNLAEGEEKVTEISRVKTSATIDNLDALVGTILNLDLIKEPLTKEGEGAFNKLFGLTRADEITLQKLVDAVFETYLYDDKGLNSIMDMLIGLLGGESSKQIVNIVLDILAGAGYDLTPQNFKANVTELADVIGDAKSWDEVVKNNSKYQYVVKNDKGEVTATYYDDVAGLDKLTVDGEEIDVIADMVQKQVERKENTDENDKLYTEYLYNYSVKAADGTLTQAEKWLKEAGKTEWIEVIDNPETEENEEVKHIVEAVMADTEKQKTAVKINATWGLQTRDDFVNMLWNCIKPLAPIFAALFCEGDLTIFDKISIKGSEGYEGFVLPLIKALGIPALKKTDGTTYLAADKYIENYDTYKNAVYNDDGTINYDDAKIMLTTLTDAIFALVDSLCARPVNTILTIIPYLAHFIESDGIDTLLANLLVPVTTITGMIEKIYKIDLLGLVKDLLRGLIKDMNDKAGETSDSTDPAEQATTGGAAAAYLLNVVEGADSTTSGAEAAIASLAETDEALDLSGGDSSNYTFKDIIVELLEGVSINGTALSSIVDPEFIFLNLASTAWKVGSEIPNVVIDADRRGGSVKGTTTAEVYTVDRESVLINVLNDIVFTDGIRDLIGGLLKFDFSKDAMTSLKEDDSNYLLTVLLYGVFEDPEALERLLIDLLSWYDVEYEDARVSKKDFSENGADALNPNNTIDYKAAGLDKAQMEKLPADFDSLIGKIVPAVLAMLPEDALGDIKLRGDNIEAMVHNLLADLMMDKEVVNEDDTKETKYGFATQLVELLVNLLGGNATVSMIVGLLPTIIDGVDIELRDFKAANASFNTYFAAYDTWAEAYEGLKTVKKYVAPENPAADYVAPAYEEDTLNLYVVDENGEPVYTEDENGNKIFEYQYELKLTNTNSFGVTKYEDVLTLVSQILAPLAPILRFLLTEADLVLLDGVHVTGGDGYDRFIIPLFEMLGVDKYIGKDKFLNKTAFAALDNAAFTAKVVEYIDGLISMVVNTPIQTIVDLVPELVFFIYSDGLAQAVEQLVAPLLTLVDMVNDITAKEIAIEGREDKLVALDIVGLITDLINEKLMTPNKLAEVDGFYGDNGLITRLLTANGLESLLQGILDNANAWRYAYQYTIPMEMVEGATEDELVTVYFNKDDLNGAKHIPTNGNGKDKEFTLTAVPELNKTPIVLGLDKDNTNGEIIGIFKWILEKTCKIEKVDTIRTYGAEHGKVWGVKANRADTLVQIISETILGGDMLTSLLAAFGVQIDGTVQTILDAVTGENRYVIFVVLLKYFNEYDVETMIMDYLSFEKVEYAYETYVEGTKLTQRKLRRAIKKLDGSILTVLPELMPMLEEVEFIKMLLDKVGGYHGQSLKDLVHELLQAYAFNDQTMNQLMGLLVGLLGGEDLEGTLSTVLPLVKDIVGINVTPYGFMEATSSETVEGYLKAAIEFAKNEKVLDAEGNVTLDENGNEVVKGEEAVTWTDVADFYRVYVYSYNNVVVTEKIAYTYKDKDGNEVDYYVDEALVADDEGKLILKDGENTYELTANGKKEFYSYTAEYMYSKADLGETYTDDATGKTWYGFEQATDVDGNLNWDDEAKGIPAKKTVEIKDEDGNVTGTEVVRATTVNALTGSDAFVWGIDDENGYDNKKDAFVEILGGIVTPLEGVLNFLLRGESLAILPDDNNNGILEFKGNNGYDNVIRPLFQALAVDQFGTIVTTSEYMAGKGTATTLTAITDGIFTIIEALTDGPLEYILTLLPSLSYFISCNGPEVVLNNLLSPVLALLNLADPIVGDLLNDLLGSTLSGIFGDFMPENLEYETKVDYKSPVYVEAEGKKVQATDKGEKIKYNDKEYYITAGDGELLADTYVVETETVDGTVVPKFNTYKAYALTDILKICGEYGENLVRIINNLVGPLLLGENATEEEKADFKLLEETFFADYPAHSITINKQTSDADFYYFYTDAEGNWYKIKDDLYDPETMGDIVETHYVVDWFKVDIADSLVFLLENVLTESLLTEIAEIAKVDINDEKNILGVILKNLIEGNFNGLVVADIITALFENYTITYNELYGEYIEPDHSHLDNLSADDQLKAEKVPAQLDNIIKEALPAIAPILSDLLAPKDGAEPTILNDIFDNYDTIADDDTVADLYEVVEYLLNDLVWSDELVNTLAALIINLIGGNDLIGTIIGYFGLTGIKLDPQSYLATVKKAYGEKAEMATAVAALESIIGTATTWADVVKNDTTPLYAYEYVDGVNEDGSDKKVTVYLADADAKTYELTKTVGEGEEAKEVKYEVALTKLDTVKAEYNKVVDGETVADLTWGVAAAADKKDAFIKALAVIVEPLFPVLQLVLQGKTLTLVGNNKNEYTAVNMKEYEADGSIHEIIDDSRSGNEIGNGYVELMGVNGYEELLVPILDAIGGIAAFGAYSADNKDGIMTAAEFGAINNAYDMLAYIVNVVFGFVNNLVANPVTYLATYLPSLLYFIGSDGVYNAVHSVLQLVNGLIAVAEPLIGANGIKLSETIGLPLDLKMLKLEDTYKTVEKLDEEGNVVYVDGKPVLENVVDVKGLCSMINDLIKKPGLINKDMILKLAGYLGDYKVISTVRSTASSALLKYDETLGEYIYVDKDGNGITDANPAEKNKITTIVGDTKYTLTGLLQFALADGLVGGLVDTSSMEGILKSIIDNVMGPDATKNVSEILIKLLNKYIITYQAIEDPATALVSTLTDYAKYGVEKTEVQLALSNLQKLLPKVLELLGVGSLESLVADNLYTDKVVNGIIVLLVGLLGGMDDKTWTTITDILGYVKDIVGLNIDITPAAYAAEGNALADFINAVPKKTGENGEELALTWADVAEFYTKYEYRYMVEEAKAAEGDKAAVDAKYVTVWFSDADLDGADHTPTTGDYAGKTFKLEKVETTSYEYKYTVEATEEGKEDEVVKFFSTDAKLEKTTVGEVEYAVTKTGETEVTHNTKIESDFVWGLADAKTLNAKADKLVDIVTDLLKPLDSVLSLLLAGGVYEFDGTTYGDSLGAFKEINIMGGSGYNYAIIPLLETLCVPAAAIKTQAEYEATIESEGTLGYILKTVLHTVNDNLDTPLDFVLGLFANLAYTITKDGVTTFVSNLIAPLSEVIEAIEGVLPVAINVNLMALMDGGSVAEILLGNDVALKGEEVGLTLDLDCDTLEALLAKVLAKYVSGFDIEIKFADIAAKSAKVDEMGDIVYSNSKVDPKWDICVGTPGKNIEGDAAATIITLLSMVITSENIDALLQMLNLDLTTLDPAIADLINKAIDSPDVLIGAVIKLLASNYDVNALIEAMVFYFLGEEKYDYSGIKGGALNGGQSAVNSAIGKFDKMINNLIPGLLKLLGNDLETPVAFIADIYNALAADGKAETANIKVVVDYLLNNLVFNDKMMNYLLAAIVNLLGGIDEKTFTTIVDIVKEILDIDLSPAGIAAISAKNGGKLAAFIGTATTWAELADAHAWYEYRYMVEPGKDAVGEEGDEGYVPAVEAKYVTTHFADANLDRTEHTPTTGDYAGKTFTLEAVKNDAGEHVTKVILTETWGITNKDSFLGILYEITAVIEPLLAFLFKGANIRILIDEFNLKGGNGYVNAIVPLAKALNIDIEEDADKFANANEMLKEVVNGIFGLVEDIEAAPISTILEVLGSASYFIANNGIALVINNLIAPVTGLLSIFEKRTAVEGGEDKVEGITMDDINALLKSLINMDLNDITGIAGADGSKLVAMINDLLPKVELVGEDGTITIAQPIPADFFVKMSQYAINYEKIEDADETGKQPVTKWSVDKADVLMYLLSTVCSDEFIAFIASAANMEEGTVLGDLIYALSGNEDLVINIISMLLNKYSLVYDKYAQVNITKIDVTPKDPLTDNNLTQALQAIDGLVPALIGLLVKDADSLKGLVENLVAGADLGNLLMNLLVPVLAGLDIDEILGYVKEFSNLDIKLAPEAWNGTVLEAFIGNAETWAEVAKNYTQYEYAYTEEGAEAATSVYRPEAGKDDYTVTVGEGDDAKTYTLAPVYEFEYTYAVEGSDEPATIILDKADYTAYDVDGNEETAEVKVTLTKTIQKSKMVSDYDWNIDTFNDLKTFVVDLLKPLDVVFKLLLAGSNIVIAEDNTTEVEDDKAQITVRGGDGYNFAIIPLLEAIGATGLKDQDAYEKYSEARGSHLEYILEVLLGGIIESEDADGNDTSTEINGIVNDILAAPVSQLMSRLANLFYFIGNNSINTLADNLLAPVNTLINEIDELFPLAINIDVSKVGVEGAEIIGLYLGKAHSGIDAGIHVNVQASALAELLNNLLSGIEINGTELGLSLDLNWLEIAAKMAKTEAADAQDTTGAAIAKTESAMAYDAYENVEGTTGYVDGKYYNIQGDVVDTFVTLLQVILTDNNTEAIRNLITGILPADMDATLKGILDDILSDPDAIEKLIGVVVLLLTGESELEGYAFSFAYKYLGEFDFNYKTGEIDSAISKFDSMIAREAVSVIKLIGDTEETDETKWSFLNKMAMNLDNDDNLADLVEWLLEEFAFTADNYVALMEILNTLLADLITADLAGIIATILPIKLMPYEFAAATGNAKLIAYVAKAFAADATEDDKKAVTWADVREAYATETKDGDKSTWTYSYGEGEDAFTWGVTDRDSFVSALLDMLKPLNPILDFIFAGQNLKFEIDGVEIWGANGYDNAIVPLLNALGAKQLGVNLPALAKDAEGNVTENTTDALGYIINALLGTEDAKGVVDVICEAPLTTILTVVGNLSYFLANDNLESLIKNLVAPVLGIVELAESLISRDQLDGILESLIGMGLTDIIEIGNNKGGNLVALINDLLGGIRAYEKIAVNVGTEENPEYESKIVQYSPEQVEADKNGNYYLSDEDLLDAEGKVVLDENGEAVKAYWKVLQVINLLPDNFFVDFAKYVVEDSEYKDAAVTKIDDPVDDWTINTADALMYILSMVLDYDFFETILKKIGLDLSQGIGETVLAMADKENELIDVLVMLLNDYGVVYKKIEQPALDTNKTAPYEAFGTEADGSTVLDNANTSNAIAALDPLVNTIIGMVAGGNTLSGLINDLIADADLANLIMNALVPVLSGLELDSILAYVNELTNIKLTTLNPTLWSENDKVAFGSALKTFLGDAKTWAEVEKNYIKYEYTYVIPAVEATETTEAVEEQIITVYRDADEKTIVVGEGKNAVTYDLTPVLGEDGKQKTKMASDFEWGIDDLNDLVPLVCDLLQPLDVVFQILLSGKPIIALEDESAARADIRIQGGYGYNYAIIPLLEAFGATGLKTQEEYNAYVAETGSSLKYILETLIGEVNEILETPLNELLSRLANLFYFIGSNGINTIADNLLAPLNTLIEEVDDLFPLAIRIDLAAEEIIGLYLGKEHDGIDAGITVNVSGSDLSKFINDALAGIKVNGKALGLELNLNWVELAAKMAARDDSGVILTTGTKQVYDLGTIENADANKLVNITGDAANALVTLLDTVLTEDNCEAIADLVSGLLGDSLQGELKNLVDGVLASDESIKGLVAAVILIFTGEYDVATLPYVFKALGSLGFDRAESAEGAVTSLDAVLVKGAPVIIKLLGAPKEGVDEKDYTFINKLAKHLETKTDATLSDIVDYLLNDLVFTDALMGTITGALLGLLKGLSADLVGTIGALLGVELAPEAFAAATKNEQFINYIAAVEKKTDAEGKVLALTWADVAEHYAITETVYAEDGETPVLDENGDEVTAVVGYEAIFSGVSGKDAWTGALLDMLKPLDSVLGFLLTGENLVISIKTDDGSASVQLKGGNAYETALIPLLYQGLGLEELVKGTNKSEIKGMDVDNANDAIKNVLDAILVDLVGSLEKAPLTTILTVVGNLSYFIANDDVAVVIENLLAPVFGIVDSLSGVVSRAQLDALIESLVDVTLPNGKKLNITNIINIAGDGGAILIDLINGLLPEIEIVDPETKEAVGVVNALPKDFFVNLAKAAVTVKTPANASIGADVTEWTTNNGNAILYVLSTVLTTDFLNILCEALKLEPTTKNEDGTESENMVYSIVTSLAGKDDELIDLLLMLLNKYLVTYKTYEFSDLDTDNNNNLEKIDVSYASGEQAHQQLNKTLEGLDALIPVVVNLIGGSESEFAGLGSLVYPLFVKDDIANALVSAIVKLLAGLPVDTLTMIEGLIGDLSNLENTADGKFSIAPQAFTTGYFGSKLDKFIGEAETWAEVVANNTKYEFTYTIPATETAEAQTVTVYMDADATTVTVDGKKYDLTAVNEYEYTYGEGDEAKTIILDKADYTTYDVDGNAETAKVKVTLTKTIQKSKVYFEWGIKSVTDFINLICDFLNPLDCILELILMGGADRVKFENGEDDVKSLSILKGVNVCGGNGYNYAIIPLLEIFGVQNLYNQAQYEAYVEGHNGSTLHYVLTALFGRVDEILNAPIKSVLEILANLSYVLANGNLGTIVENLIAPINVLIKAVDPIFPIAIKINIGNIGAADAKTYPVLETYLGKAHPGVEAGLTLQIDGGDISTLINNLVSGIAIKGEDGTEKLLGLNIDLNWTTIAKTAAADDNNDGIAEFTNSKMSTAFDIYNGTGYKNLKGDLGDTFYVLLKTILTEENWAALKKALNLDLGTFEGLIQDIIKDPTSILDLIVGLLGNGTVSYIPVQNRPIDLQKFDYRSYGFLTETNADIIAANIDQLINDILDAAGFGDNLKALLMGIELTGKANNKEFKHKLVSNGTVNMLLDLIVGLLAGESIGPILEAIAGLEIAVVKDGKKTGETVKLDLTVQGFYKEINRLAATRGYLKGAAEMLANKTSWAQVGSFQDGIKKDGKGVNWNITNGNLTQFVQALAGVLTPLNPVLKLLLMGEGTGLRLLDLITIGGGNGYDYGIIPLLEAFGLTAADVLTQEEYEELLVDHYENGEFVAADETQVIGYVLNRIAVWADKLLSKPVDELLTILPNVAYFLSNEGLYLTVRNVAAPVFGLLNAISGIIPGLDNILKDLDLGKIINGIDVGNLLGPVLGAKLGFRIPVIDFYKLAQVGSGKKEVATSRSLAAGSFKNPTNPHPYIENYPAGYEEYEKKATQTFILSDKGDTLTYVFSWLFRIFGDAQNREALVQWLVAVFDLKAGSEQTVRYAIDQLFKTGAAYGVPDIIVTALFHALGLAVVVDQVFQKDFASIQTIFKQLFKDIANGSTNVYGSIARIMEQMTGIWNVTVGSEEDYEDAKDSAEESLNWFQRIIKKIKEFFAKIFGIFG